MKRLKDLAPEWDKDAREVTKLTYDSRLCVPGSVFFAFDGTHTKGSNFVEDALSRGAIAIVADRPIPLPENVAALVDGKVHGRFARMCSLFYDEPEKKLSIIGVTGTDGKSTTCDYLYQLLKKAKVRSGLLGTVAMDDGSGYHGNLVHQSTPEADTLEAFLARCVKHHVSHVVLECTSHGLSDTYDRLHTIHYDGAIVTTVTREHLEFHKTIESYVQAKCNLARRIKPGGFLVSTVANPHLEEFLEALPVDTASYVAGRDLDATVQEDGSITYRGKRYPTSLSYPVLAGNALLAAMAASLILHTRLETELESLANLAPVAGRMVSIPNRLGLRVIIDYAHTEDAYEKLFSYVSTGKGRILACFGCAGERDPSKRSPMGRIASHYANAIFLTEEDPRKEPVEKINREILRDAKPVEIHEIEDRKEAIRTMVDQAKRGDTLLFLGKGHECTQEKGGLSLPWNERQVVEDALRVKERRES